MAQATVISSENVKQAADGSMTITFKPDATGRPSEKGKNMVLATTEGFVALSDGTKVSVNVIRRR